jgi:hypothetical protein
VRFIRPSSVSRLRCLMESAIPGPWFEPGIDAAASHQRPHRRRTVAKRERCTVRQVNLTLWLAFRRRAPAARHHADHPLDVLRLPAWSRQADDVPDLATKSGSVESSSVHVEGWGSARPGRLGAAGSVSRVFWKSTRSPIIPLAIVCRLIREFLAGCAVHVRGMCRTPLSTRMLGAPYRLHRYRSERSLKARGNAAQREPKAVGRKAKSMTRSDCDGKRIRAAPA